LNSLLVTNRARFCSFRAAEAFALITDDRLDRGEQLGRGHQANRNAGAAEDRFNDFAVVESGDDDTVLDGVSTHDAAGGNFETEDGIAGGRKLVNQLLGRSSAIEGSFVAVLENDNATAFDARIVGVDCGGDEVGKGDVGDEPAAFFHLQPGLFAVFPLCNAYLAAQHAGIDADIGDRLSQGEGSPPGFAGIAGLRWSRKRLVAGYLQRSAALVNGGQS